MIRAVYFDYHGVLDLRNFAGLLEVLAKAAGAPTQAIRTSLEAFSNGYATGEVSPVEFWNTIQTKYGAAAASAGKRYILHVDPVQVMWEAVNRLHTLYSVGLFSDCPSDKKDVIIRAYNLPEFFDQLIFSCDVRQTKMDPNFYRRMLRDGLYQPGECVLIDDSHQAIGQAKSLGFQTHEFLSVDECVTFCLQL